MVRHALRRGAKSWEFRVAVAADTTHRMKRWRDFRDRLPQPLSGFLIEAD
jgi:hypothetical protein